MPGRKRDKKGRVLREGETCRSDGRYMFRYTDKHGNRHSVYSWRLVANDVTPPGKKNSPPLRDLEKKIRRDLEDQLDVCNTTTVDMAFESFMSIRPDLKETTKYNYKLLYDNIVRPVMGKEKLSSFRQTDIKRFYISLIQDKHYSVSTTLSVHNILRQVFEQAVCDQLIRINPARLAFTAVRRMPDAPQKKKVKSLTEQERKAFLEFVYKEAKFQRYANLMTVLLGTGLRIGEALGLRWEDCDFDDGTISVNHSLRYKCTEDKGYHFFVVSPKTPAGYRIIPMLESVRTALLREREKPRHGKPVTVDGYTDFVFLNGCGNPISATQIYDILGNIVSAYNSREQVMAKKEGREPILLPKFGPHVLRHTFCTWLCENESNLKVIQDVMGHKSIKTTMDVYTDATAKAKAASFAKLDSKFEVPKLV